MSQQIIQNKGPKKMGHFAIQKPHINTDNSMSIGDTGKGPLSPTSTKQFTEFSSSLENDSSNSFGAPYMSQNEPIHTYSNKFMEKKVSYDANNINSNIIKNTQDFSHMDYNINSLKINETASLIDSDMNQNELIGYDNLFSNFDNYANNRDISLVNNDMINNFQNRFIKDSANKLEYDIDATGSSNSNKINGSNLNNLNSFHSIN